ncbi:hypothetical protein [Petropleomorpha daqingensis]|uniref:MYXO-CTERM domain-containing protein n=1 Tax=Petropleomorpha daqingensis TaxID=2026353 RepID=A0A853CI83_9ACTN|nr:hypothetical protein [Petropleomorpha daqingensis]NYJ05988.1 hypothetical protein [Petropleomorpha daqingensis]
MSGRLFGKPLRLLAPAVLLGAVVLVPGVAAADDSDPVGTATTQLQDAASQLGGSGTGTPSAPTLPDNPIVPQQGGTDPVTGGGGTPALPGPPDDSALRDAFIKALAPLGISADCVNGVFDGFQNVLTALQNSDPQQLPDLLNQLVGALQSGDPSAVSDDLQNNDVGQALQGLATTLQEKCMPAPPTGEGAHSTPPPASAPPVAPAAQPPAPPAPAPVAQPVSYPGYAPTGGTPDESSSPVPLAVLAGVVLASGIGAAGYRMSTRAARSRG